MTWFSPPCIILTNVLKVVDDKDVIRCCGKSRAKAAAESKLSRTIAAIAESEAKLSATIAGAEEVIDRHGAAKSAEVDRIKLSA